MIAVIDYGAGNLHSVCNALEYLQESWTVTRDSDKIHRADRIILPGVGAFGDAMKNLRGAGVEQVIKEVIREGKPFLGICLGLHLLFEESEESPGVPGLGILKGKIEKIPMHEGIKIPHMGWNDILLKRDSRILGTEEETPYMYFVHSYYMRPEDPSVVSAAVQYGEMLDIAVERDNLFAVQFHPEKSGRAGLRILKRFARLSD